MTIDSITIDSITSDRHVPPAERIRPQRHVNPVGQPHLPAKGKPQHYQPGHSGLERKISEKPARLKQLDAATGA